MRDKLLNLAIERGMLLSPEALEHILGKEMPLVYLETVIEALDTLDPRPLVITFGHLQEFETGKVPFEKVTPPTEEELHERSHSIAEGMNPESVPFHDPDMDEIPAPEDLSDMNSALSARESRELLPASRREGIVVPRAPDSKSRRARISMASGFRPPAAEVEARIELMEDITGNSTCEGRVEDFHRYFMDRYQRLRALMVPNRPSLSTVLPIKRLGMEEKVAIVGIVSELGTTRAGSTRVLLEDTTGQVWCIIPREVDGGMGLVYDEVVGIVGRRRNDFIVAEELYFPDVPLSRRMHRSGEDVAAAFISDIHVGSNTFLMERWEAFIDWLNGRIDKQVDLAGRIKYIVLTGDLVDGIGIYPNQLEELEVDDIIEQYEVLAEYLQDIPDHIEVIAIPGNHDAVRPAEPQPALPQRLTRYFDSNVHFFGNPARFALHGVEVLAYHGNSIIDWATNVQGLSIDKPIPVMKEMLKRRHLAPIYGGRTPLAPEQRDTMIIHQLPDIFVTGHVHACAADMYRNILLINSSTWQDQTIYQRMMNFVPDPGKVTVVNLNTYNVSVQHFT